MTSGAPLLDVGLALLFVLGLMAVLAAALRRWRGSLLGYAGPPRLTVLEVRPIDTRTRLVLVRHDEVEHLLVIGGAAVASVSSRPAVKEAPACG
jgi:flagellar biogenesis protein FliO